MITEITLENFKSFRHANVRIAPLTLLSGVNGSGKSSVLQSIAVMKQSKETGCLDSGEGLLLNGEYVELGTGRDALYEFADNPIIGISITDSGLTGLWRFNYSEKDDLLQPSDGGCCISSFPLFERSFQFLRADRIAPAVVYPRSYAETVRRRFLGVRGQFAPHFLAVHQDESVSANRCREGAASSRLLDQVNAWMADISPGVVVGSKEVGGADLAQLYYKFGGRAGLGSSNDYRPTNVGFGLTYCLPIVVACLSAKSGDLLLIENPEAHLHPKGQTMVGALISKTANDGVQILVESHSEHVLNGIRLAVKNNEIEHHHVALHFFQRSKDDEGATYLSPTISNTGRLNFWPEGFFDEWENSLLNLV